MEGFCIMFPQYKNERWATQAQPTGPLVLYLFNWCMNEIKQICFVFFFRFKRSLVWIIQDILVNECRLKVKRKWQKSYILIRYILIFCLLNIRLDFNVYKELLKIAILSWQIRRKTVLHFIWGYKNAKCVK